MSRLLFAIVAVACLGVFSPRVAAAQGNSPPSATQPQISVSATGEVQIRPDRATIMFSVETRAATAAAAGAENARRQKSVSDALKAKIGSDDRLTTAGYSVSTDDRYDGGQRKVVGYIARNTVVLETRSI